MQKEAAIHLMIAIILNQSVKSRQAFDAPQKLLERLDNSCYDLPKLAEGGYPAIQSLLEKKPSLHRYPSVMAKYLHGDFSYLCRTHQGDPRKLWEGKTPEQALEGMMEIPGVGRHKAVQFVLYLGSLGELRQIPETYADYMNSSCPGFFANLETDLQNIVRLNTRQY